MIREVDEDQDNMISLREVTIIVTDLLTDLTDLLADWFDLTW